MKSRSTAFLVVALPPGVVGAFRAAPTAAAQQDLIHRLLVDGATRVYADYWTCLRMIFESDERVACSVVRGDLSLALNRYPRCDALVRAALSPAYVFALYLPGPRHRRPARLTLHPQHRGGTVGDLHPYG